jgi:hypothetical protein
MLQVVEEVVVPLWPPVVEGKSELVATCCSRVVRRDVRALRNRIAYCIYLIENLHVLEDLNIARTDWWGCLISRAESQGTSSFELVISSGLFDVQLQKYADTKLR